MSVKKTSPQIWRKINLDFFPISCWKIDSKCVKILKIRGKHIKLNEENGGDYVLRMEKGFLNKITKEQVDKKRMVLSTTKKFLKLSFNEECHWYS